MYRQLCSYCHEPMTGSIVYVSRVLPDGAKDLDIEDNYMRVWCPACEKVYGNYDYRIESMKKYILFGTRRIYAIIPGNALDGKEYEISGYSPSLMTGELRRARGKHITLPIRQGDERYSIYMASWWNNYC